jgi:hypothetical protein
VGRALFSIALGSALVSCSGGWEKQPSAGVATASQPLSWAQQPTLTSEDGGFAAFGVFVKIDGTTALVSDHWFGSDSKPQHGKAFVFDLQDGVWVRGQGLVPSTTTAFGFFGFGSALQGETILIGAPREPRGAVYAWARSGETWSQTQRLEPADAEIGDGFGAAIALDGDLAVIGAPVDGTLGPSVGAAYVYRRENGSWTEEAKLYPEQFSPGASFGDAVAVEAETIVVGAPATDAEPAAAGRAHVFVRTANTWTEQTPALEADDPTENDAFGRAIAISASDLVIGAPFNGHAEARLPGVVHWFSRDTDAMEHLGKIAHATPSAGDELGVSLSLSGAALAIGAPGLDERGAVFYTTRQDAGWADTLPIEIEAGPRVLGLGSSVALGETALLVGSLDVFDGVYAFSLLGGQCDDAGGCATGHCVDSVCCERACDGLCERCDEVGSEGVCLPAPELTADPMCDAYVCGEAAACKNSCESTADCAPGHVCDAGGRCVESIVTEEPEDGGCALTRSVGSTSAGWLALAALALMWRRRSS